MLKLLFRPRAVMLITALSVLIVIAYVIAPLLGLLAMLIAVGVTIADALTEGRRDRQPPS